MFLFPQIYSYIQALSQRKWGQHEVQKIILNAAAGSTYHFYGHAINALQKIKVRYNPGKNDYENLHLFYNSSITIGSNVLLKPDKTCINFKIFRVFKASAHAGHKQKVFNKIQSILKCLPAKSGLQTMETHDNNSARNGWTSMQNCNTRQIYELLMSNTNCMVNQHFKRKWAEILNMDIDWQKVWKTFHENKAENKIKSEFFVNYISTFSHHSWLSKAKYKPALFATYAKGLN